MSYGFNGTTDIIEFGIGPFSGYTFGPFTMAVFLKRNGVGSIQRLLRFSTAVLTTNRLDWRFNADDTQRLTGGSTSDGAAAASSTSVWYLLVVTRGSGTSVTPRYHIHNGTSWAHGNFAAALTNATVLVGSDRLVVGLAAGTAFSGDMATVGIKKADSSDATVETLSRTAWTAWTGYGFDWLIGFDASQEVGGVLQDQGTAGTGDEIAITGTSVVGDPPGWTWPSTAAPFVPRIAIL